MPCCRKVEIFSDTLLKTTEFNQLITHHIGIGCLPFPYLIDSIGCHIVPIFTMQIDYFQWQAIPPGRSRGKFYVLFGRTVHVFRTVHTYFNIKQRRFIPLLTKEMNDYRAVYPTRY